MNDLTHKILRPASPEATRIFFLARSAPLAPNYTVAAYPGDGGYPAYYQRIYELSAISAIA
jgi:D-alanine-D-alanine ligase